jgi:two-component system response regulator AtoC
VEAHVPRVLVVDDHRNTRDSLALGLRSLGCEADAASDADEALARQRQTPYDWIVCDVRMPGSSGVDLARALRRGWPALGLVLMTAFEVSLAESQLVSEIGASLWIKPVPADRLFNECLARIRVQL